MNGVRLEASWGHGTGHTAHPTSVGCPGFQALGPAPRWFLGPRGEALGIGSESLGAQRPGDLCDRATPGRRTRPWIWPFVSRLLARTLALRAIGPWA